MQVGRFSLILLLATSHVALAAGTPEQKCAAGQNDLVGKLAACVAKAQKKFALSGDGPALSAALTSCAGKFGGKWDALERKAADDFADCPGTVDRSAASGFLRNCMAELGSALHGGTLPLDVTACNDQLATCKGSLTSCQDTHALFPASGQLTPFHTGSDGETQGGATMSHTDNGDGTITDNVTGLMWEKKDDGTGLHSRWNRYTWTASPSETELAGTITDFLAQLNSGSGFAGHTDWRLPNIKELQSIYDYENPVDNAFHRSTCSGCTDVTSSACSCSTSGVVGPPFDGHFASSTTNRSRPSSIFAIEAGTGGVIEIGKRHSFMVRAVRGPQ